MLSKEKERIDWVDIAKGIGIIAVVIVHFLGFSDFHRSDYVAIYIMHSFHMPLFFFISGFLYKQEDNLTNVVKKFCQLIIPYMAIMFFLLPILYFCDVITQITIKEIAQYLFWGGRKLKWLMADAFVPMWFLTCLFLTSVLYNILSNVLSNIKLNIAIFILLLLAYVNSLMYPLFSLPWNLQVVLCAIAIFHVGRRFREYNITINWKINIPLSILVFAYILSFEGNWIDMAVSQYGYPFISLICAIITIMLIRNISMFLSNIKPLNICFSWIGRISLTIMAFHYAIYFIISKYIDIGLLGAVVAALAISSLLHWIFDQFKFSQILFLGKGYNDIEPMFKKMKKQC